MKAEILLISISTVVALASACVTPDREAPLAPEPIGPELLSYSVPALGLDECVEASLYRSHRSVQLHCFTRDGTFSWENRGTLSIEGEVALDAAIAVTDFDNTEPAPDDGLCKGNPDAISVSMTLWVGEESFTYHPACPTMGIAELNEVAWTLAMDINECEELDLLDSVEPGCRAY